jgi:hypothetical protein
MGRLVMGQELRAAIDELTRGTPYTTRSELYKRYFRNADWKKFNETLTLLATEGLVISRSHPQVDGDRIVALTAEGRGLREPKRALARGRRRRHE